MRTMTTMMMKMVMMVTMMMMVVVMLMMAMMIVSITVMMTMMIDNTRHGILCRGKTWGSLASDGVPLRAWTAAFLESCDSDKEVSQNRGP